MPGRRTALVATAVGVVMASGCSGGSDQAGSTTTPGTGSATTAAASGTITVMAPAPLKGALDRAKVAYESAHPGTTVTINYGHIPALLTQISQGVPADILVTPDEATMKRVQTKGVVGPSAVPVARNELVLVTPADNSRIKDVKALGDTELTVATCAPDLPCGKLATEVATKAGITLSADTQEPGGSPAIVTKAAAGEIDVGVCFAVDTKAAGDKVTVVPLPDALGATVTVTAAALKSPSDARAADQYLAFLSSADGKTSFTEAGFAPL